MVRHAAFGESPLTRSSRNGCVRRGGGGRRTGPGVSVFVGGARVDPWVAPPSWCLRVGSPRTAWRGVCREDRCIKVPPASVGGRNWVCRRGAQKSVAGSLRPPVVCQRRARGWSFCGPRVCCGKMCGSPFPAKGTVRFRCPWGVGIVPSENNRALPGVVAKVGASLAEVPCAKTPVSPTKAGLSLWFCWSKTPWGFLQTSLFPPAEGNLSLLQKK